jgi:hypothetical protein
MVLRCRLTPEVTQRTECESSANGICSDGINSNRSAGDDRARPEIISDHDRDGVDGPLPVFGFHGVSSSLYALGFAIAHVGSQTRLHGSWLHSQRAHPVASILVQLGNSGA